MTRGAVCRTPCQSVSQGALAFFGSCLGNLLWLIFGRRKRLGQFSQPRLGACVTRSLQFLPRVVSRPKAPPVKSQGIKTKLVPFILGSIRWDGEGRWIEPFVGSGAVLLNAAPRRALVSDANEHLIRVYQAIQCGQIAPESLREFLDGRLQRSLLPEGRSFQSCLHNQDLQSGEVGGTSNARQGLDVSSPGLARDTCGSKGWGLCLRRSSVHRPAHGVLQ